MKNLKSEDWSRLWEILRKYPDEYFYIKFSYSNDNGMRIYKFEKEIWWGGGT